MNEHTCLTEIADLKTRYDLYGGVHKGLRRAGCELLLRLGSVDFADAGETEAVLSMLRLYLDLAASHVMHEDLHIHQALQARGVSTATVDHQHDDHRRDFAALEALAQEIESAAPAERRAACRKLYLAFAAYLADDLAHMHEEETVTAPALWGAFTDDELMDIERRIIGSIPPEKNMAFMRAMIPAMNPAEREALLGGMQRGAPAEVFNAVIEFAVRPSLPAAAFRALASRLRIAA
ncbi:hypothetical protein [Hoeflea olei]|uniref:Hemerythrin-like domain-containing protein n=1 Tax=Hoeflea olei TaxID=1480615 RepID=A0A1C1Z075_9HYPH|nr:hypothetical protein [Hoeflea olei]OCW59080.1 hypothetical protein AWJ14_05100 [Hoeflea olei]